ncbi:calcium-binding protein [Phaeobacter sp.]|uniref:calcium-binding protein n=1 Tax=Phaeobacter sp. TaxID=1902409 RepID=UPI0025CEAE90|nr:calcium-binding protein [Phaeobacter sp.]
MANVFIASTAEAPGFSSLLALEGFDVSAAGFDLSADAMLLEQQAADGTQLQLQGDFSDASPANWLVYSIDLSLDGAAVFSISNMSIGFEEFAGLSGADRERALLAGDDAIVAQGNATTQLHSYRGNDELLLGAGDDSVIGGGGRDLIRGGLGEDELRGAAGADRLHGNGGDDILYGGTGRDKLFGGLGHDELRGGGGRDRLMGGNGSDTLFGGAGADRLLGGGSDDILTGGAGADVFIFNDGDHTDTITDFEVGVDRIRLGQGADDLSDVDLVQVGDNVEVYFANVTVIVENTELAALNDADNFLF